ncbi:MAG: crotonase/enoyl-CoA hydratase family protein [Actinomycetota bacterium]
MARISVEADGAVRVLRIERPENHNCIDGSTAEELCAAVEKFSTEPAARVLVVTGRGEKAFCTGADLKNTGSLSSHAALERAGPLGFARLDPGKPVIGAINGYAFAGGLELAAWCDFRIAAENAEFGILNRRWGIPLIDGGTQRLARIVGMGNAMYLISTGMRIDAHHALRIGLVQEVVPEGAALARAVELARRIAGYPQSSLIADRRSALSYSGSGLDDGLMLERASGRTTLLDPEMARGLQRFDSSDRPEAPRPAGT